MSQFRIVLEKPNIAPSYYHSRLNYPYFSYAASQALLFDDYKYAKGRVKALINKGKKYPPNVNKWYDNNGRGIQPKDVEYLRIEEIELKIVSLLPATD